MEKKSLNTNLISPLLHLLGWVIFLFYPFILGMPFNEGIFIRIIIHSLFLIAFFYTNVNVLIPRLLTRGKITYYFLSILLAIIIIASGSWIIHELVEVRHPHPHMPPMDRVGGLLRMHRVNPDFKLITKSIVSALFIFGISTSYKFILDWFQNEKKKKEIENEKLVSELAFLKSQVSPHFLFNTLNNIYSLSLSNSSNTSEAILKLSQLLRYMLYESEGKHQVSLGKEIEYLQNYIVLQKMRIREDVKIEFNISGEVDNKTIEPMLLIPFIENAFKHGINYSAKSFITIDIVITDNDLSMKIENTLHGNKPKDPASGIGLINVKRRLNLLYPNNHQLNIEEKDGKYIVIVEILFK